jgi:hypothetical protein
VIKTGYLSVFALVIVLLCGSIPTNDIFPDVNSAYGAQTPSPADRDAILRAIVKKCPAQWCNPEIVEIIGEYASVIFWCKKKNCENDTAFLKKVKNKWILVEQGTGIEPDDLKKHGFPGNIANKLISTSMKRKAN